MLYKICMAFTLTLPPDIEQQLRLCAAEERRSVHKTVELAVHEYLERRTHRKLVLATFRRVMDEDGEFFEALGDR